MRPYKTAGENGVIPKVLKNINNKSLAQLNYISNACLQLQYFQRSWKNAMVIPLRSPHS